jgi:hypothetical protein
LLPHGAGRRTRTITVEIAMSQVNSVKTMPIVPYTLRSEPIDEEK